MSKSYKKTVLQVEVLSDGAWKWDTLEDVAFAISEGPCSGTVQEVSVDFLTAEQTAVELVKQGSDPSFLLGDAWEGWTPPKGDKATQDDPEEQLRQLTEAMEVHGNAEGTETQLGDAEAFLALAFSLLTAEQRKAFLKHSTVTEFLEANMEETE